MSKSYATWLYVLVLLISLTACGGSDEFDSKPSFSATAGMAGETSPDAGKGTGGSATTEEDSGSHPAAGSSGVGGSPTDTAGKSSTGGSAPSTGGSAPSTGGSAPSTGGKNSTGGSAPSTGGFAPSTGGSATGGSAPSTGGSSPSTGGSATGGSAPSTGGSAPSTGGKGTGGSTPSTGGSAPSTGGTGTGGTTPSTGGTTPSTGGTGTGGTTPSTGGTTPSTGGTGTGGSTPSTGGTGTGGTGTGGNPPCSPNLNTDPLNCGSCGHTCNSATETCQSGTCSPLVCPSGTGNCDGNAQNGCEVNTTTLQNCGGCGVNCTPPASMAATCSGVCQYACLPGFANCDGTLSNGCEVSLNGDPTNCGACGHSCFGGTCTNGTCQFAVEELYRSLSPTETIVQLAVNSSNLFWTTNGNATTNLVRRIPKIGGTPATLATGVFPWGIVARDEFVYWSNGRGGATTHQIQKTTVSGGTTTTLATDTSTSRYLSVDGSYVYWLNADNPTYNSPAIVYSVPVGGGSVQPVVGPFGYPAQVVASGDTGNLCFSYGPYSSTTTLRTVGFECVGWTADYNPYHHYSFPTGPQVELVDGSPLAVANGHVYWKNEYGVAREDKYSSGNMFLPGTAPTAMIGDATHLLWNGGATGFTGSTVFQVPLNGGTIKQLAPYSTDNITAMASDGTYVYWTNGTYIRRAPKL
jgi:hypothetical protein